MSNTKTEKSNTHKPKYNPKNNTKKEQAKLAKKGGKAKSKKKTYARIKNCSEKCPYYSKCDWISLSLSKYKGKCAVKHMSPEMQNAQKRLLEGGREGLIENIALNLVKLQSIITRNPDINVKELSIATRTTIDALKAIHGEKQEVQHKGEGAVTFAWFTEDDEKKAKKEVKE